MFLALVRSVSIATILSILVLMLVISIHITAIAATIAADEPVITAPFQQTIGKVRLQLERAPAKSKN